jgi:hypothetical protein
MSENETAPARQRRGREHSATSSNVRGNDTDERAYMHRWRSAVFNSRTLSQGVRVTLLALAEFADETGANSYPAAASLAKMTGSSERTVRTALGLAQKAGWFVRAQPTKGGSGSGKEWASYRYSLVIPEDADTRRPPEVIRAERIAAATEHGAAKSAAPSGVCSGNSRSMVRQFPSDGAATVAAELAFDLANNSQSKEPKSDALASADGALSRERSKSSQARKTFDAWLESFDDGADVVAADDPVFDYADKIGLPRDFLVLAWKVFEADHEESPARSADWPSLFGRHVRKNYFGIWFVRGDAFALTTRGKQAAKEHNMRHLLADEERA